MADAELKFYRCLTIHSATILPAFLILATYQGSAIHQFEGIPVPRTCRDQLHTLFCFFTFLVYFFAVYLYKYINTIRSSINISVLINSIDLLLQVCSGDLLGSGPSSLL